MVTCENRLNPTKLDFGLEAGFRNPPTESSMVELALEAYRSKLEMGLPNRLWTGSWDHLYNSSGRPII